MVIRNLAIDPLKFDVPITVVTPGFSPSLKFGLNGTQAVTRALATTLGRICTSQDCHYCRARLREADPSTYDGDTFGRIWYDVCDDCGFWRRQSADSAFPPECTIPVAKGFDPDVSTPALDELAASVLAHPDRVSGLDPTRFELLVGSILRNHFQCEVIHTGRTGDGGVDLLAVLGEKPLLIQVKRRTKQDASEGIEAVKLMIASTLLRKGTEAMLVTSAERFTKGAKRTAAAFSHIDRRFKMTLLTLSELLQMVGSASYGARTPPYRIDGGHSRWPLIEQLSLETVQSDRGLLIRAVRPDRIEHFAVASESPDTVMRWNVDFELDPARESFEQAYDRSQRAGTDPRAISMTRGYGKYGVPIDILMQIEEYAATLPASGVESPFGR